MKPLTVAHDLLAAAAVCTCTYTSNGTTANTVNGPVGGACITLPAGLSPVNKFLGIPYATPPQRFKLATAPEPWEETLDASEYGPACLQYYVQNPLVPGLDIMKDLFVVPEAQGEDCLYVNVYAPATASPRSGRPVLIFIPGGGFGQGHGGVDLSGFAAYEDIVAVTFNYRLNIFGFPNTPDIPLEERNLGLHDQRLALQWVQDNAAAFGGDPSRVTIMGHSAGALSADAHINSYANAQNVPFRAAILLSGQMSWGMMGYTPPSDNPADWNSLAQSIGCPAESGSEQLECFSAANATRILEEMARMGATYTPLRDNMTLPSHTAARWRSGGGVVRIPLMMGTVAEEGRMLVNQDVPLDLFFAAYLPDPLVPQEQKDAIVDYYRELPGIETDFDLAASIYTDYFEQCPQNLLAQTSALIGNPTWRYHFNASIVNMLPDQYSFLGIFHGTDLMLLLSTPTFEEDANGVPLTPQQYTVATNLRAAIGRFVKNPENGPGWPAVGSRYMPFDVANIGDSGGEHSGWVTVVNQTELEVRCGLYEGIYPLIEEYVLH